MKKLFWICMCVFILPLRFFGDIISCIRLGIKGDIDLLLLAIAMIIMVYGFIWSLFQ